jgi:ATP synthase protein I
MPPVEGDDRKRRQARWLLEASSIGWMFPIAILLGVGIGWWLDKTFGTKPWMTIVFGAFGVVAAFINLFRIGMSDDGSGK